MPRNSQGLYTLPAGNPVVPNTLIEAAWANMTMSDIGDALTGSLPRNGAAPMTGPLTLANSSPIAARHAASKGYVDNFLGYASGLPVGAIVAYGGAAVPPGYLVCDGSEVSRTDYAVLFGIIGTIYGVGDGTTTFTLPDLRDQFIRGKSDARELGSFQASSVIAHKHALNDPGHDHQYFDPGHSHNVSHTHGVNDPGHSHSGGVQSVLTAQAGVSAVVDVGSINTGAAATGVSIQNSNPASTVNPTGLTIYPKATGLTMGYFGGDDTYPENIAFYYLIKAINDSTQTPYITAIESDDVNCVSIDATDPGVPILEIHTNVPLGLVKLDESGSISPAQLSYAPINLLGTFDASGGLNPSEEYPAQTFITGDWYITSAPGTITVYDPDTDTTGPHAVNEGDQLLFIASSPTGPTGWYWLPPSVVTQAINVGVTPSGTITATNTQAALEQLDTLKAVAATSVATTSGTGAALMPIGDTAERPAAVDGMFRYNSETGNFEGFVAGNWLPIGVPLPTDYEQGFKNPILNGGFQIWQRGTSFTSTGWTADRWFMTLTSGACTFDRRTKGNASAWDYCRGDYVTRMIATGANGKNSTYIENVSTFSNQRVVLSFKTNNLVGNTGAAPTITQHFGTGGSPAADVVVAATSSQTVTLGGGFFSKQYIFDIPSVASKAIGTNGNDYLEVAIPFAGTFTAYFMFDMQLERGDTVTPFDVRPVGEMLARCKRFYQVLTGATMQASTSPSAVFIWRAGFPTSMRKAPTVNGYTLGSGVVSSITGAVDSVEISATANTNGLVFITNILLSAEM